MRIITDYQTVDTHAEPAPLGRECERQVHLTRLRRGRMRVAGQSQPDVARQIVDDRAGPAVQPAKKFLAAEERSEEHTSELQSLMRISYAVFCLKKKKNTPNRIQQYDV